jgi:hypothetical protein
VKTHRSWSELALAWTRSQRLPLRSTPFRTARAFDRLLFGEDKPLGPLIIEAFAHYVIWRTVTRYHYRPEAGLVTSADRSLLGKRILEWTSGRCRAAAGADHVDQGAQRGRYLAVPGIIEE